jgi:hypothetical protein
LAEGLHPLQNYRSSGKDGSRLYAAAGDSTPNVGDGSKLTVMAPVGLGQVYPTT